MALLLVFGRRLVSLSLEFESKSYEFLSAADSEAEEAAVRLEHGGRGDNSSSRTETGK